MSFDEKQVADLLVEILGDLPRLTNCLTGSCTGATAGQAITIAGVSAQVIIDIPPGGAIAFQDDDLGKWYALPLVANSVQYETIIRSRRTRNKQHNKELLKVKSLIGNQLIEIGGHARVKRIIDVRPYANPIYYVTNFGGKKYLVATQYQGNGNNYFLIKTDVGSSAIISFPISLPYYYLGNSLWESISSSPQRFSVVDKEKKDYPVTITVASKVAQYNRTFTYATFNATAGTWLPTGNSSINWQRTRDYVNYDRPPIKPINERNPQGVIINKTDGTFQNFKFLTGAEVQADSYYQQFIISNSPAQIGDTISTPVASDLSSAFASLVTISYTTNYNAVRNDNNTISVSVEMTVNSITEQLYVSRVVDIVESDASIGGSGFGGGTTFILNDWFSAGSRALTDYNQFENYSMNLTISGGVITGEKISNGETSAVYETISLYQRGIEIIGRIYRSSANFPYQPIQYNDFAPSNHSFETTSYSIEVGELEKTISPTFEEIRYLPLSWPGIIGPNSGQRTPTPITVTDNAQIKHEFVAYTQEPPPLPDITLLREDYTERVNGSFVGIKTVDGYIKQDFSIVKTIKINYVNNTTTKEIITNNNYLTYVNGDRTVNLNTNNFLVINNFMKVGFSDLSLNSTNYTIYVSIPRKIFDYMVELNGSEILYNCSINDVPCLVVGTMAISFAPGTLSHLRMQVAITNIVEKVKTSFFNKIITNNGSFWNYLTSKNSSDNWLTKYSYSEFLDQEQTRLFFKPLVLNPAAEIVNSNAPFLLGLLYSYVTNGAMTDNIVGDKIYRVVEIVGKKANIEQWNILPDGRVYFYQVFKTDYYPIFAKSPSRHSFHPK